MSGIRLSLVITGLMETRLSEEDIATNFQPFDQSLCKVLNLKRNRPSVHQISNKQNQQQTTTMKRR